MTEEAERAEETNGQERNETVGRELKIKNSKLRTRRPATPAFCLLLFAFLIGSDGWKMVFMLRLGDLAGPR